VGKDIYAVLNILEDSIDIVSTRLQPQVDDVAHERLTEHRAGE
jgi:hypothetical protein